MVLPLCLVVAVAQNGVIGRDNQLIWRLKTDLQRFKALTTGKPVLMGRKTYQSIGKPLPAREIIVLTRDPDFHAEGIHVVSSLEEAHQKAAQLVSDVSSKAYGALELMVAGGAQIYAQTLPFAERVYLTQVALHPKGDTFFPPLDPLAFKEDHVEHHDASDCDECAFSFHDYVRIGLGGS